MSLAPAKCWYEVDNGFARTKRMIWREVELTEIYMDHLSHKIFCFGYGGLVTHLGRLHAELKEMIDSDSEVKYSDQLSRSDLLIDS